MSKKVFEITIEYTESTWGTCYVMVEAETEEEAKKLFEDSPDDYDWNGWETHDSEMRDWNVDSVDVCPESTKKLQEKPNEV